MSKEEKEEKWTVGGRVGSRGSLLLFRCSALSLPPSDPPAGQLHMVYKTHQAETKLLAALLNAHGFVEVSQDVGDFNLLWTGIHPKPQVFRSLAPHQRVNHFPRSYELTRKDRLYKNIERMQYTKGVKHFDFIPQTFVMPTDFRELTTSHYRLKGPWIIKPVASSRGRGIYIVNSPDEVPLEESVVVAKYIDNPLLVSGHKCDLRLYVAVTSFDPLVAYMYEEGLVRFATVKYDTTRNNLWNPCMHLCNYSINKHHSDYIKSDDAEAENVGHKWTLSALLRHLRSVNIDTALLMQRIEETVVKSLLSTAPSIVAACKLFIPHQTNCFELFGFDLLIDNTLKPWLLEVNLSPSLGCDSPLDMKIKSALLADLLTLVGIPAVDPMTRPKSVKTLKRDVNSAHRAGSADTLPKVKHLSRLSNSAQSLTPEENRILSNIKNQFSRRGGFVRIFPAANTWKMYNQYLDPVTGIPGPTNGSTNIKSHNLNFLVHNHLFPEVVMSPRSVVYERIARYERVLTKGHTECLQDPVIKTEMIERLSPTIDAKVLKRELIKCLEDGFKFSQTQVRQVFSQYLHCVLNRMSGGQTNKGNLQKMDDAHSDLVLKFVQRAAGNLRTPYHVKSPSQSLTGKDRIAVIAKQLSDFLYQYNKETESLQESSTKSRDLVPNRLFQLFLSAAREGDLEEVLLLNTRLYKCAQLFLGRCGPAPHKLKTLGLLQSLGTIRHKVTGRNSCECVHEKTLPQSLGNKGALSNLCLDH